MNTIIYIIPFFFISCQKQDKIALANKYETVRALNHLNKMDQTLTIDSTLFIETDPDDWRLINHMTSRKDLKTKEESDNFCIIDLYSDTSKKRFKTLFYSSNKGVLKLIAEQDRFYKKINDSVEIYLNHHYNYQKKEALYSIDTLPTKLAIEKNNKKIEQMFEYARNNNLELCGTAVAEITEKNLSRSNTQIQESEFKRI